MTRKSSLGDFWKKTLKTFGAGSGSHDTPSARSLDGESQYKRGMIIQTSCRRANVHNYKEMAGLLERLASKYPDTKLMSIGKSYGYRHPDNKLDVWSLKLPATRKSENTAFFVSGHHYCEWSGPETVSLLAKRMLESFYLHNNPHVHKLRESTHLIFIPHIDVDAYDNLEELVNLGVDEFYMQGYLRFISQNINPDVLEFNKTTIECHEYNFYDLKDELPEEFCGSQLFNPSKNVKSAIVGLISQYGQPFMALDYHERRAPTCTSTKRLNDSKFMVGSIGPSTSIQYVYEEVGKSYFVLNRQEIRRLEEEIMPQQADKETFSAYLSHLGANSYYFEPPSDGSVYDLHERIEMNLIATDRILARHYLGV